LCGNLRERSPLEEVEVDEHMILKWIFRKWNGGMDWIIWLRIGTGGGQL
jgi:hypothetical protein